MTTESKHSPKPWWPAFPLAKAPSPNGIHKEAYDLINAAPDLLEALKALVALGSLELPHQRDAAINTALAAIAKAEGRNA